MNSYLDRLRRELESVIGDASLADLAQGPEGKWKAHEILEHLWLTYRNTNKGLTKCIEKGNPLATQATFVHRLKTFIVVRLKYLPSGSKAPERVIPRGTAADEVMRTIYSEILEMDTKLSACERTFGTNSKILDHPFMGPLTANQWRIFHFVHGRHHASQIRQRLGKS